MLIVTALMEIRLEVCAKLYATLDILEWELKLFHVLKRYKEFIGVILSQFAHVLIVSDCMLFFCNGIFISKQK